MSTLEGVFRAPRPLVGMVHLAPLPGSPRYGGDLEGVLDRAERDAGVLAGAGFDGLLVENFGDAPFLPGPVGPETVAAMAVAVRRVAAAGGLPVGVNVLRNDARAALAVAVAAGGAFIRVNVHVGAVATDQGLLEGRAHETLRERSRLGAPTPIFADVLVKHGRPLGDADPARLALDTVRRGLADALLVTGAATGSPPGPDLVAAVKGAVPDVPVLVASGLTPRNARALLAAADGAIVGTSLKRGGHPESPVDRSRATRMAEAFREATA